MSDNIDIGTAYYKNNGAAVKVTINTFKGQTYVHLREYGYDGDKETWYPTKSGYSIIGEELDSVIEKLNQASKQITIAVYDTKQLEFDF